MPSPYRIKAVELLPKRLASIAAKMGGAGSTT
jgi:hypothetical protein